MNRADNQIKKPTENFTSPGMAGLPKESKPEIQLILNVLGHINRK